MTRRPRLTVLSRTQLLRTPLRAMSLRRVLRGGRLNDMGRLPRYAGLFGLGALAVWVPVLGYLATAPLSYTTQMSLILPGSGATASVNLNEIGQASSSASSAFSSPSLSPTVTYKRLIGADRIVAAAAQAVGVPQRAFGAPQIELIDQTGLINIEMTGPTAEAAQARGKALLAAFAREVNKLRNDEMKVREDSVRGAMLDYQTSVANTRAEISDLQRSSGLISADQYNALVAEKDTLQTQLNTMKTTLVQKTAARDALQASLGIDPDLAAASLKLIADPEFSAVVGEIATNAAKLAQVEGRFGPNHPLVRDPQAARDAAYARAEALAKRITGLSGARLGQIDLATIGARSQLLGTLVSAEAERAGLAAEVTAMQTRLEAAQARVKTLIEPASRLEDLKRRFAVSEAIFASAMARTQTSKVDLYASYPLVQVLEDPSLPVAPSSPKRKIALAAGGAGTLFMLIGLILGWVRRPLIESILEREAKAARHADRAALA